MSDESQVQAEAQTVRIAAAIISDCRLNYGSAAPIVGVAPATLRHALMTLRLPVRAHARRAIERFTVLNANAHKRADLRFVEDY